MQMIPTQTRTREVIRLHAFDRQGVPTPVLIREHHREDADDTARKSDFSSMPMHELEVLKVVQAFNLCAHCRLAWRPAHPRGTQYG